MRFFRKSLIGLMLISLSFGLLAYAGQMIGSALPRALKGSKAQPEGNASLRQWSKRTAIHCTPSSSFCEVQSRRTLDLRMASGGQVVDLSDSFVNGGQVKAGELLVQLSTSDAQSALQRAEADVTDALDEVAEAQRALSLMQDELKAAEEQEALRANALARQVDLQNRGVGTTAAVETAELAASAATQALLAKRSALIR